MPDYQISLSSDPSLNDIQYLGSQLEAYNIEQVGYTDAKRLTLFVRDENGQVIGGLTGWTYWDWLAIDLFWLHEVVRGRGYGTKLLRMAEEEAKNRGCKHVLLDTFSFQAPDFYQRHGYELFGTLAEFAGKHKRYYFRKVLG